MTPRDTHAYGIPVSTLDPTWTAATVLAGSVVSIRGERAVVPDSARGPSFLDVDLDNDGSPDRAVVGVYSTSTELQGRFLLVLRRNTSGRWAKAFVASQPSGSDVTFLGSSADTLFWFECLECRRRPTKVFWDGRDYRSQR